MFTTKKKCSCGENRGMRGWGRGFISSFSSFISSGRYRFLQHFLKALRKLSPSLTQKSCIHSLLFLEKEFPLRNRSKNLIFKWKTEGLNRFKENIIFFFLSTKTYHKYCNKIKHKFVQFENCCNFCE